jgi:F0F1-type ATP synthase membrane subunit b/b'
MAKKKEDTLDLYQVLEILNHKINSNTTQLEINNKQLEDKFNHLKIQLDENKVYLLENIEKKAKASLDFLASEFKKEANENRKNINSKQERLVSEEFKKLKTDINNDLEDLANKVMNSRIL